MCFEQKEVSNGVVGEEQVSGSPKEEESRVNDVSRDVNNGLRGEIQVNNGFQVLPPESQGSMVRWERFLPTRSLKVLLVENDDSTRHVVSALLRNCCYEVSAAANGLEAWKILEDPNNHSDLVLAEVVMPVLSGIGLLCKIMSHRTLKNIPVIMMSSHDSMGIVFKCLSKGAVDFLVKPIRKNELKNLWQHVWRRCHSSSGSVSESGTQTRKSIKSRSNDESENDTGSSDENHNGSPDLSIRDGSDNASGTQNSRAGEVDSSLQMSPGGQSADTPDSTCVQVIHTKPGKCTNRWVHSTETKECQEQDEQLENVAIDKDLEKGVSSIPNLQCEYQQKLSLPTSKRQDKLPDVDGKPFDKGQLDHSIEKISCSAKVNCTKSLDDGRIFDISKDVSSISQMKASYDSGEFASLELTLKRLRGPGDVGNAVDDDNNILRHSDLSAFSKYNTVSSASQTLTGNVGSCSPVDNSSVAPNTGAMHNFSSHSKGTLLNQQSIGSHSNNAMASISKCVVSKEEALSDKPESESAFKSSHLSAFQPLQSGCLCKAPQGTTRKEDDARDIPVQAPHTGSHQRVQVQHHHHHHHHYHHHVHDVQQPPQPDHDEHSLKEMAATAQQCGSSNVFGGHVEIQAGNYSVNGSASGSNHGSNGHNGSSTAMNVGMTNLESDSGAAENSGGGGISRRKSGNEVEENQVAQRVAALTKFHQKRKERCFEKRVRYHSRKKLAEQRPRIRGQFVRQSETNAGKEYQSEDLTSWDNSGESTYNDRS